jgi:hypothetical protein
MTQVVRPGLLIRTHGICMPGQWDRALPHTKAVKSVPAAASRHTPAALLETRQKIVRRVRYIRQTWERSGEHFCIIHQIFTNSS